jgi:hypothetical protein
MVIIGDCHGTLKTVVQLYLEFLLIQEGQIRVFVTEQGKKISV